MKFWLAVWTRSTSNRLVMSGRKMRRKSWVQASSFGQSASGMPSSAQITRMGTWRATSCTISGSLDSRLAKTSATIDVTVGRNVST